MSDLHPAGRLFCGARPHWSIGLATTILVALAQVPAHGARAASKPSAEALSDDARRLVAWIAAAADHGRKPFVVIDKRAARLWAFDGNLVPRGSTPVLLGLASGDHTVPGIGDRPLAQVLPHERTTPAGRFAIEAGVNTKGEDIFWVDYDAAVSMHRVRPHVAAERRLQRLASPTPRDNRISYGCINIPTAFYDGVLKPLLGPRAGTAYLLPDTQPLHSVFPALGVGDVNVGAGAAAKELRP